MDSDLSDLSDLYTFKKYIDNLPESNVIEESSERYVDDVEKLPNINDISKCAKALKRYYIEDVNTNILYDPGYSVGRFEKLCKNGNNNNRNCHECCSKSEDDICEYDENKCTMHFAKDIRNWNDLVEYHLKFLNETVPGTMGHPFPWNGETRLIVNYLKRITKAGVLTFDSQPGLYIQDKKYDVFQKPYLSIACDVDRMMRIMNKLFSENNKIKYVDYYEITQMTFDEYPKFEKDGKTYVEIFFGIDTPSTIDYEYCYYVFTDEFFKIITNVIENTP